METELELAKAAEIFAASLPPRERLTHRETLIFSHIVQGRTNQELSQALGFNTRTVAFHRANIMLRLGAKDATHLASMVIDSDKTRGTNLPDQS